MEEEVRDGEDGRATAAEGPLDGRLETDAAGADVALRGRRADSCGGLGLLGELRGALVALRDAGGSVVEAFEVWRRHGAVRVRKEEDWGAGTLSGRRECVGLMWMGGREVALSRARCWTHAPS